MDQLDGVQWTSIYPTSSGSDSLKGNVTDRQNQKRVGHDKETGQNRNRYRAKSGNQNSETDSSETGMSYSSDSETTESTTTRGSECDSSQSAFNGYEQTIHINPHGRHFDVYGIL